MANTWTVFSEAIQFGWRSVQHDLEKGLYDVIALYKEHTKLFTALAPGLAAALEVSGFAEIDTEKAKASAEKEFGQDTNRLAQDRDATLKQRQDAHKQRVQEIQDEKNGTLKAINDMADAEDNARRQQYDKERQDSEDELKRAKDEWRLSVEEARQKREAAERKTPEALDTPAIPDIAALGQQIEQVMPEIQQRLAIALEVTGSFSADALRGIGLGQSTTQERAAKAAEDTAKNTKRIAERMEDAGELVFE
jgi:hypothetical protein